MTFHNYTQKMRRRSWLQALLASGMIDISGELDGLRSMSQSTQIRSEGSWNQRAKLTPDGINQDISSGYDVFLSGDGTTALIGSSEGLSHSVGEDAELAIIFQRENDSWNQKNRLVATNSAKDFGRYSPKALSSDGTTALIGVPNENNQNGEDAGSVYIFSSEGDSWSQETELTLPNGNPGDNFGSRVALSNDDTTAVFGGGDNFGYVYTNNGSSWSKKTELTQENTDGGAFANSVAISNDGKTIAIGYVDESNQIGEDAGSVYVFSGEDGNWSQQTKLVAADGSKGDEFGYKVSISSDGTILLISAASDNNQNGKEAGAAYVFANETGTWSQKAKLSLSNGDGYDYLADEIALSNNGTSALLTTQGGGLYVFSQEGNSWSQEAELRDPDNNQVYGFPSVTLSSDGTTALSGSENKDNQNGEDAGSVYVFSSEDGNWSQQAELIAADGNGGDEFGSAAALSSDGNTCVVGAPGDEGNGERSGSAYVFSSGESSESIQTIQLEQVDFDRTPHITTTETDDYDTIPDDFGAKLFGAPISSSLLIQVEADLDAPVTIDEASIRLEDSSGQEIYSWQRDLVGEITTGTYTYRVQLENGIDELPPGEYTAVVTLPNPLSNTDQDSNYEYFDGLLEGSTEFTIEEKAEAPILSVPKADYDDDGQQEQAIGKPVNVSLDENPARKFFKNTFSLIAASVGASDTFPAFGVNKGAVNDLAINTAQARLQADDSTISIYWQNKRTRNAESGSVFEIPYDRAVVTAKVPDSVTIADNGGADYAIHNTDAEQYELTWITTEIDKGIPIDFTTFGFDYNNPTGIESFEVESDSEKQITIEYGLSLQLGPLLQNPAERPEYGLRYYIPIEGQIADVQGRYDYETWQENPDEMYWASIGVDQRTSTVNLSGSASVEIVNPTLEPPAVETGQSTQHTLSFEADNVSADGTGDKFEITFPDKVNLLGFSDVDIESPSSNIEKNDNTLNFSVDPSGGGTTQVSVSMTVTLSTASNSTVVDGFEDGTTTGWTPAQELDSTFEASQEWSLLGSWSAKFSEGDSEDAPRWENVGDMSQPNKVETAHRLENGETYSDSFTEWWENGSRILRVNYNWSNGFLAINGAGASAESNSGVVVSDLPWPSSSSFYHVVLDDIDWESNVVGVVQVNGTPKAENVPFYNNSDGIDRTTVSIGGNGNNTVFIDDTTIPE